MSCNTKAHQKKGALELVLKINDVFKDGRCLLMLKTVTARLRWSRVTLRSSKPGKQRCFLSDGWHNMTEQANIYFVLNVYVCSRDTAKYKLHVRLQKKPIWSLWGEGVSTAAAECVLWIKKRVRKREINYNTKAAACISHKWSNYFF